MNSQKIKPRVVGGEFNLEEINMEGRVTIRNGDRLICKNAKNHFVDAGLKGIISTIISSQATGAIPIWSNTWHIYLGQDTTTPTTTTMTELMSPIGAAPGTAPNNKTITSIHDGTPDGDWYAIWQARWNPGSISGTVGEAALYMCASTRTNFGWAASSGYGEVMVSRLSAADTDFSSFIIDTGKVLAVDWKIRFYFG